VKKFLLMFMQVLVLIMMIGSVAFGDIFTEYEYNASGDTSAAVTLDDQAAGRRYEIISIYADSDLSSAVLSIQKADAVGVTTSYTTVATLPQTDSSAYSYKYENNGLPVFIGEANYRYKITLTSTTANSLIVNYDKK